MRRAIRALHTVSVWSLVSCVCCCLAAARVAAQASAQPQTTGPRPSLPAGSLIALLPVTANAEKAAVDLEAPLQAIAEQLRARGYRLVAPSQVSSKLSAHALEACKTAVTCDPALALASLGADAVISTAVWMRDPAPPQLVVHLRHRTGYGQAEVASAGPQVKALRAAAVAALRAAIEDSRNSHEVDVLIESQPSGATAHVDQTLTATTPAHFSLLPGNHLISVETPGYVTRAQYLELPEHGTGELNVQLQLEVADATARADATSARLEPVLLQEHFDIDPASSNPAHTAADRPRRSGTLNYVLAASLLGVAVPLLANAIYAGATQGNCAGRNDMAGRCSERVTLGPLFAVSLGLGALAAAGGSALLIFQPFVEHGPMRGESEHAANKL